MVKYLPEELNDKNNIFISKFQIRSYFSKSSRSKIKKSSINVFYEFYLFWSKMTIFSQNSDKIFENSPGNPNYVIWLYNESQQILIKCQNLIRYAPIRSFPLQFPWRSTLPVCARITSGHTRNLLQLKTGISIAM